MMAPRLLARATMPLATAPMRRMGRGQALGTLMAQKAECWDRGRAKGLVPSLGWGWEFVVGLGWEVVVVGWG